MGSLLLADDSTLAIEPMELTPRCAESSRLWREPTVGRRALGMRE